MLRRRDNHTATNYGLTDFSDDIACWIVARAWYGRALATCCLCLNLSSAQAFVRSFEAADFVKTTVFSNVTTFGFSIDFWIWE